MAKLKLDLREVKTTVDPVPPGRYGIEVIKADVRKGKKSEQPYLWLDMKITEGEWSKRHLFFQGTLNQDSDGLGITFRSINALLRDDVTGAMFELDTDDLVGCEALAVVKHEEDLEGNMRERVQYLREFDPEDDRAIALAEAEERPAL
jgi:hypothetical protein